MSKPKKKGEEAGRTRTAFGHDIVTRSLGDGGWCVQVMAGGQVRRVLDGFRFEGEAYWAGEDWAEMHRLLCADTRRRGDEWEPIVKEMGKVIHELPPRRSATEAMAVAEQYCNQLHEHDRKRVLKKQELRAEYILRMREFDALEVELDKKMAVIKEAKKLLETRRQEFKAEVKDPQIPFNFVFDRRKSAEESEAEEVDGDATSLLAQMGVQPPKDGGGEARL